MRRVVVVLQRSGKVKSKIEIGCDLEKEQVLELAQKDEKIKKLQI